MRHSSVVKEEWKNLEKSEVKLENMSHVWLQQCTAYDDLVVVNYTKWVIYSNRATKCEQNDI